MSELPHRVRRSATVVGPVLAMSLCLSACGSGGSEGSEGSGTGTVEGSTMTLATANALLPQYEEYARAYTEAFPDREVEVVGINDVPAEYIQRLSTAQLSGDLPDVFFTGTSFIDQLAQEGITADLAPGVEEGRLGDLALADFLPQFVDQYRPSDSPDEVHGLPVSADSTALFYNADLFEQAGVDELPQADWTWEDMYRTAEEIQSSSGGNIIGLAAPATDGSPTGTYGPVIEAFGGYVYDPETNTVGVGEPEALQAWELLLSAYGTTSAPYAATPKDPVYNFTNGTVAMALASSATVPATRSALEGVDWDVQIVPSLNGEPTTNGGSYGMSMAAESDSEAAAWAFLEWFYDADAGQVVAQEVGGTLPPTTGGLESDVWRSVPPPPENVEVFAEAAREAVLLTPMPGGTGIALQEATKLATQQVLLEGRAVDEAFAEAQRTVNDALAEEAS